MNLKFFLDPANLKQIGHRRIARLFQDFADDLQAANISLPDPGPETDDYFVTVAGLIASPAFPQRVRIALALIELFATPENLTRLDDEIARHLPCISFERTRPAVDRAIELWVSARDAALKLADELTATIPDDYWLPSPATPQPNVGGPVPQSPCNDVTPVTHVTASPLIAPKSDVGGTVPQSPCNNVTPLTPVTASTIQNPSIQQSTNSSPVPSLKRLTDPRVLERVGVTYLDRFFQLFAKELAARNISIPDRIPEMSVHAQAYAKLFSQPELLPQRLVDALVAIEEFASPKNKRLLEKLASDLNIDESREPEGWALCLWLKAPFDLQYIKTLQAHLPENFYDGDIEYCDPDEDEGVPSSSSSAASASSSPSASLAAPKLPSEGGSPPPIVEINPCPRNKIARLPREVRDSINRMLGQGRTYAEILRELGEHSHGLNKSNLWRWKRGPYQAWLKHQQRLEESGAQLKFALEAVRQNENNQIHQATQQIAALRISELFSQLDISALKEAVINEPATVARLADLLPKLSQGGLQCERQRHELAQAKPAAPAEKPRGPIKRGISRKALRYVEQKLRLL